MDYSEFRAQYEQQHPASIPALEYEVNEYAWWVRWLVLAAFICTALVSGVHTVPTVWKGIEVGELITPAIRNVVSLASLAAVELGILLSAYLMAKGVRLAYIVMAIASLIAVAANLYSVVNAFNAGGDPGALFVAAVLGIGAPLIALFTGKMFVDIHRADRIQDARARRAYREALVAWDARVEKAWKSYLRGVRTPSEQVSDNRPTSDSQGQAERVRLYLTDNPDAVRLSVRDLSELLNVGRDTAHRVKREFSENGNHLN